MIRVLDIIEDYLIHKQYVIFFTALKLLTGWREGQLVCEILAALILGVFLFGNHAQATLVLHFSIILEKIYG